MSAGRAEARLTPVPEQHPEQPPRPRRSYAERWRIAKSRRWHLSAHRDRMVEPWIEPDPDPDRDWAGER